MRGGCESQFGFVGLQLFDKAVVGPDDGPHGAQQGQGVCQRQAQTPHEKGNDNSAGAGDAGRAVDEHAALGLQCLENKLVGLVEELAHVLLRVVVGAQREVDKLIGERWRNGRCS